MVPRVVHNTRKHCTTSQDAALQHMTRGTLAVPQLEVAWLPTSLFLPAIWPQTSLPSIFETKVSTWELRMGSGGIVCSFVIFTVSNCQANANWIHVLFYFHSLIITYVNSLIQGVVCQSIQVVKRHICFGNPQTDKRPFLELKYLAFCHQQTISLKQFGDVLSMMCYFKIPANKLSKPNIFTIYI